MSSSATSSGGSNRPRLDRPTNSLPLLVPTGGRSMSAQAPALGGSSTIRVAAIQTPAAQSVPAGLAHATPLVERAAAQRAQLVLLPELMATRYVFSAEIWDSAEPNQGPTVQWLRDNARRLGIWLARVDPARDPRDISISLRHLRSLLLSRLPTTQRTLDPI